MKVIKKNTDDGHIKLDVTVSTSEVSDALDQSAIQFCNTMGIRPERGKSPAEVVSKQLGIKDLDSVVGEQAIERLIPMAINKHGIVPAYMPTVETDTPIKRGRTYQFSMEILPKPEYELTDYGPVSIKVEPFQSDEEEVDLQISKLAQQYTQFVKDDPKPVHAGDTALIKIEAKHNGEIFEGLSTDGRVYTLGRGYMPEGFDEGIDGMQAGETRTFTFEGPELDDNNEIVYEPYECTVTMIENQKEIVPVVDDAWVKQYMPMYGSYEAMRADIAKEVDKQRRQFYDDYLQNCAATELANRFEGSIPDEIYEGTVREISRNLHQQVASSGLTWEKFVEQQGGEQQVSMMLMVQTRQQLVQGFALDAYYRHYNLSYTEEDLDAACFQLNPRDPHQARRRMEQGGLGYALREAAQRVCACKHLVEHAEITERETAGGTGGMGTIVAGS